jgi:hypothetical protein
MRQRGTAQRLLRCGVLSARRARAASPLCLVALLAATSLLLAACSPTPARSRGVSARALIFSGSALEPSPRQHLTTFDATHDDQLAVARTAQGLAAALRVTSRAAGSDELAVARDHARLASGLLDVLGVLVGEDAAPIAALRGTASLVPQGMSLLERELRTRGTLRAARNAASQLVRMVQRLGPSLDRAAFPPSLILARVQTALDWAIDVPIAGLAEPFTHDDLLDVEATVVAARASFDRTLPLCQLLAPSASVLVEGRFGALLTSLRDLSRRSPDDAQVREGQWAALSGALDAIVAPLGELEGSVQGFASGRLYT